MGDDSDPQLTLRASLDPSGVASGADQAADALGKVKDSAADAGEGINNSLDNRRAVTHALRGLMELREGGVMAIAGLSSEAFVATEAFEAMLGPLAPILMTLTLIASIGIPMFARMKDGAGDTKEQTDHLKTSLDDVKTAASNAHEAIVKSQEELVQGFADRVTELKGVTAALNDQAEAYKGLQRAKEAYEDAQLGLTIAGIERRRQHLLTGLPPNSQAADDINSRFDEEEDKAREARAAQKAQEAVDTAKQAIKEVDAAKARAGQEIAAQDAELAQLKSELDLYQQKVDEAQDKGADARNFFADNSRIARDDKGNVNFTVQNVPALKTFLGNDFGVGADPSMFGSSTLSLEKLETAVDKAQQLFNSSVVDPSSPTGRQTQEAIDGVRGLIGDTKNALLNYDAYPEGKKTWEPQIESTQKAISKLQDDIAGALAKLGNFDTKRDTAVQELLTAQTNRAKTEVEADTTNQKQINKEGTENSKTARDVRDNDLAARVAEVEANLKTASDSATKTFLNDQLTHLKIEGLQNKKHDELEGADDPSFRRSIKERIDAEIADALGTGKAADNKDNLAALHQQIAQATAAIEGGGDKSLIEAMRKVVDTFKGRTDEASQAAELASLMDLHVTQTKAEAATNKAFRTKTDKAIRDIRSKLHDSRNQQ